MLNVEFSAGSEKRFSEFISKLGREKIALITHTDLDGISAGKIINEVLNTDLIKFVNYEELNNDLAVELKKNKIKFVVMSDLSIKDKEFVNSIEKFAEVLIIDHHPFLIDFNSEKTIFLNSNGKGSYCVAFLAYYLFSKIVNLEKLDWLAACASIADWCYFDNKDWMKKVFEKYDDKFEVNKDQIRMTGKFWDLQWKLTLSIIYNSESLMSVFERIGKEFGEIGSLGEHADEVQREIDTALRKFKEEKKEIKEGFYWEFIPNFRIGSIVGSIISSKEEYYNKIILIGRDREDRFFVSARRQDGKVDMGIYLQKLVEGLDGATAGGHIKAAGASVLEKDKEELLRRLEDF